MQTLSCLLLTIPALQIVNNRDPSNSLYEGKRMLHGTTYASLFGTEAI